MDELSLYFSTENETSKSKLSVKSTKSFTRPTNLLNGQQQQRKSFRGYSKKNKTVDSSSDDAHSPVLNLNFTPNNRMCSSISCGSISTKMPHILPPEIEEGNIEYKRKLIDPTPNRFEQLVTQMKWRLNEGGGKAIYKLGVDDNGHVSGLRQLELISSLKTLERMAKRLNATLHPLRECTIEPTINSTEKECRQAIEMLVRLAPTTNEGSPDLCVALVGGMDSGKSTLIGVLTDGELDNARGKARLNLFRHLHEVQSGRTSSLSRELLGFDVNGNVTNYKYADGRIYRRSAEEVVRISSNLLTLLDLAGHSKYQRTTLAGIACNQPLIGILVISATNGLTNIGLDHIQLMYALNLPLIIVLTKIDQLSNGMEQYQRIQLIYHQLIYQFKQIENAWSYAGDFPVLSRSSTMTSPTTTTTTALQTSEYQSFLNQWKLNNSIRNDNMDDDFMPPFFPVSSVTGQGIDNLIHFLSQLSCLNHPSMTPSPSPLSSTSNLFESLNDKHQKYQQFVDWNNISNKKSNQSTRIFSKIIERINLMKQQQSYNGTLVWINQVFTQIPGVLNPVIVGRVQFGQLFNYQILWLGPDQFGDFYPVQIVSLMHHRQLHEIVYAGQSVSMEVYFLPKSWNTMNEKQRQLILHNISSSITSSPASYSAINHCKKSLTSLFDNDVEHTNENEEIIPHDHNHDVNSLSVTSSSSSSSSSSSTTANTTTAVDIYQFYSPIKIRRGMILLTYPMLLSTYNTVSSPAAPSDRIDNTTAAATALSPQPSPSWHEQSSSLLLTGNQHYDSIQFTVVWTVKLQLMPRRLPIVSFKLGNPPVILTPIPLIGQRVNIYAGCICQTGIVLESNTDNDENHSSSKYQQCESEQKSTTTTTTNHDDGSDVSNKTHLNNPTYILLRFTRHPELVEIGRQFILTWNGNLKAIGYAIELIDPVKHQQQQQQYYQCTLNDTTDTTNTSSTAIAINDSMPNTTTTTTTIDSTICWKNYYKQNYSMSFNEKDHHPNDDDCWSFDCSNNSGGGTLFKYQPNSINAFNDQRGQCSNLSSSLPSATTTTTLASMMECYEELSNRENANMMNDEHLNKVTSSSSMMMMNSLSSVEAMRQDVVDHNNTNNTEDNINAETMSSVTSTTTTTSSSLSNHRNKTKRRRHRHRGHHRHKLKKQQHS